MTGIFGAAFPQPTQVTVTLACTAKDRYGRVRIPGATPKSCSANLAGHATGIPASLGYTSSSRRSRRLVVHVEEVFFHCGKALKPGIGSASHGTNSTSHCHRTGRGRSPEDTYTAALPLWLEPRLRNRADANW
jgi:hypothetical protein